MHPGTSTASHPHIFCNCEKRWLVQLSHSEFPRTELLMHCRSSKCRVLLESDWCTVRVELHSRQFHTQIELNFDCHPIAHAPSGPGSFILRNNFAKPTPDRHTSSIAPAFKLHALSDTPLLSKVRRKDSFHHSRPHIGTAQHD